MTIRETTAQILTDCPETRGNDWLLWLAYIQAVCPNYDVINKPFKEVVSHLNELGLPSYESVSRERRYAQNHNPELKDPNTARHRKNKEVEYRNKYKK